MYDRPDWWKRDAFWLSNGRKSVCVVRRWQPGRYVNGTWQDGRFEDSIFIRPEEMPAEWRGELEPGPAQVVGPNMAWYLGAGPALYPDRPACRRYGGRPCTGEACTYADGRAVWGLEGEALWATCPYRDRDWTIPEEETG